MRKTLILLGVQLLVWCCLVADVQAQFFDDHLGDYSYEFNHKPPLDVRKSTDKNSLRLDSNGKNLSKEDSSKNTSVKINSSQNQAVPGNTVTPAATNPAGTLKPAN